MSGDPDASIRPILAEQIASAQSALEADIETLRHAAIATGDSAALSTAQNQLQHLTSLARRIDHASPGSLAAMRGEVMAFVAASQRLTRSSVAVSLRFPP